MAIEDDIHQAIEAERFAVDSFRVERLGNKIRLSVIVDGAEHGGCWKAPEARDKALARMAELAPKKRGRKPAAEAVETEAEPEAPETPET